MAKRFFVVPLLAGLLRMTSEKRVSGWTLATEEMMSQRDYRSANSNLGSEPNKAPEVLIIEKEKLLRLMMAKLLQVSGYKVYTCGDSHRGLELIEK